MFGMSPRGGWLLCGLAANPALPADLLDELIAVADAEVCWELADRADLSPPQIQVLAARGGTDTVTRLVRRHAITLTGTDPTDPQVALAAADEGTAPEAWLRWLREHPDAAVRADLATADHLPARVLRALADDSSITVVAAVATAARLPADLAVRLAGHPHLTVRRALAANPTTPPPLLAALGTNSALPTPASCRGCDGTDQPGPGMDCRGDHEAALQDLRHALMANPATPPTTAVGWVDAPPAWVRAALAQRPDLPAQIYHQLADDPVAFVRAAVAANPAIDETLIQAMADDEAHEVRRGLAHHPGLPLDVLAAIAPTTRFGPTLPPRIAAATAAEIDQLATATVAQLRMLLAARPDLPPTVVHRLADDPDAKVLTALAPNPTLTEQQLRSMVARHGARVIARVAHNPTCSPGLLHDLATHQPPVPKAYRIIAAHPNASAATLLRCLDDYQARPIAARHPALAPATVAALLRDADARVAEAAAANPALPRSAMHALLTAWLEQRDGRSRDDS